MTREALEHLIRAAADIADDDEIVVLGSQALLGQFPAAPAALRVSCEADVFPRNHPERADLIDGSIGELSPFHATYGYYAHGVAESTAVLPDGWRERLIPVRNESTRGATGWCLEVHDLVVSKLAAGREKDFAFAREALGHRLVHAPTLLARIEMIPLAPEARERLRTWVRSYGDQS
ncbi:MAG: hypothetical protein HYR72_06465 [Deltaproteobacteria bacterium]|nr:hypothetical protein [Deltaproteobacteria bacterium]MBI3387089.1 hypothetical protein [Deltaproteobacteria bacterium]